MSFPKSRTQWQDRVADAIEQLQAPYQPCPMELLRQTDTGLQVVSHASIEGALTMAAIEAIPYRWVEQVHYDDDDDPEGVANGIRWRIARDGEPDEAASQCIPVEALQYYGFRVSEPGDLMVAKSLLPDAITGPMRVHQCEDMDPLPIALVNDLLYETHEGLNPLLVWAGLMESLALRPDHEIWDPMVAHLPQ